MEEKSDLLLFEEFLNGKNEAFDELMDRYRKSLISFINKYIHNIDVAEDLAQDAFVYILVNKSKYNVDYSFKSYLFTIAKCRAFNYLRDNKKIIEFNEKYVLDEEDPIHIDSNLIKNETDERIRKGLSKLNSSYQTIIHLRYVEDFSYKEISKILNKNMSQVKILLFRAKNSLKKELGKEEL